MLPPEFNQYPTTNEFVGTSNITDWATLHNTAYINLLSRGT